MNNQDDERWRNFVMYKMYVTNDEMEKIAPGMLISVIVLGVLLALAYYFKLIT